MKTAKRIITLGLVLGLALHLTVYAEIRVGDRLVRDLSSYIEPHGLPYKLKVISGPRWMAIRGSEYRGHVLESGKFPSVIELSTEAGKTTTTLILVVQKTERIGE
jgi:hypothetical protein